MRYIQLIVLFKILVFLNLYSQVHIERPILWAISVNTNYTGNVYKLDSNVYRCEQPSKKGFGELENMGIRSVLNLRYIKSDRARGCNLKLYKIAMRAENIKDADVVNALKIIESAPKPIVVHCLHGADRTGLICAMYRIVYHGWSKQQAIDELVNGGFGFHTYYSNIPEYIEKVDMEDIKLKLKHSIY